MLERPLHLEPERYQRCSPFDVLADALARVDAQTIHASALVALGVAPEPLCAPRLRRLTLHCPKIVVPSPTSGDGPHGGPTV